MARVLGWPKGVKIWRGDQQSPLDLVLMLQRPMHCHQYTGTVRHQYDGAIYLRERLCNGLDTSTAIELVLGQRRY